MFVIVNFGAQTQASQRLERNCPSLWWASIQAHLTSLPVGFRPWLWRYTCLFMFILMLWNRNAIFESKIDKLSSSAEFRIRSYRGSGNNLTSTLKRKCRHFDEIFITGCTGSCHFDNFQCSQWWKFHQNEDISVSVNSPSLWWVSIQPSWLYCRLVFAPGSGDMFVVNFDALAQASDFRIEMRQVVFFCGMQDSKLGISETPIRQQIVDLNSPSLWCVSIQPTWLYCRLALTSPLKLQNLGMKYASPPSFYS